MLPLIFITPSTVTPFPEAKQLIDSKINSNEMVLKTDKFGLLINPIQEQFEKDKIESDRIKAEKIKQDEQKNSILNNKEWQEFIVSYYTGLDEENFANCGGKNCLSQPLERGMIASNYYKMGTQIYLDNDYGVRTVADKGSSRFNSSNRIDLYVARLDVETKEQWRKRAESYGIRHVWGYIIK